MRNLTFLKRQFIPLAACGLALALAAGCAGTGEVVSEAPAAKAPAVNRWKADDVLMRINGKDITYGYVRSVWAANNSSPEEKLDALPELDKRKIFMQFKNILLQYCEAAATGVDQNPAYQRRMDAWDLKNLPPVYWQKEIVAKYTYSDDFLLQFVPPPLPEVTVRVLVKSDLEAAKAIHGRILAGEDMAKLLREEGESLNRNSAGLHVLNLKKDGMFPQTRIQKFLDTDVGVVLEPFYQDIGYLIVRIESKRSSHELRMAEFSLTRDEIQNRLWNEEMQKRVDAWLNAAGVKIHEEEVAKYVESNDPKAVFVEVGGVAYTAAEVLDRMSVTSRSHGAPTLIMRTDKFVEYVLVTAEGKRLGLDKLPEYQERRNLFSNYALGKYLQETVLEKIDSEPITDEEYQAYYDAHKKDFAIPEERRVRVITAMSQEIAETLYERLEKGEDFAAVATEASLDKVSGSQGGDIGYRSRKKLMDPLSSVAFELGAGEYSAPFQVNLPGEDTVWMLLKVDDVRNATHAPLESAKTPTVAGRIMTQRRAAALLKHFETLERKYGYENCIPALREGEVI